MSLDLDEARHMARLARLELDPDRAPEIVKQLAAIVGYFDKLAACDTSAVEGRSGSDAAPDDPLALDSREEEDVPLPGLERERILANAPKGDGTPGSRGVSLAAEGFYSVPEMIVSRSRGSRRTEGS